MTRKIPFGKPLIDKNEINAVNNVLNNPILVHGPNSVNFENKFKEFTGAPYAVSVSSCTAGLHLVLFTIGLKKGDEVIVSSQTHVATAHAIELNGAKPIFIDSNNYDGNINPELIEKKITKRTKAISIVHYLGVPADMNKIKMIARKYNLFLLEDCALSPGAYFGNIHTGLIGDAGVFSFYPVKHITTTEGGIIILKNKKLYEKLKLKKAFGVNKNFNERTVPGMYDTTELGFNYRINEISCAIGIEQLKKLKNFLKIRKNNYLFLWKNLEKSKNIILPPREEKGKTYSYYCFSFLLKKNIVKFRTEIINKINKTGIGTSIYYPIPVPLMTYYKKKYNLKKDNFLNALNFSDSSICLPIGPHLNKKDMKFIADKVLDILNRY